MLHRFVLSACALFALAPWARADQLSLAPVADTSIYSESTNAAGLAPDIFAGRTSQGDLRRALLRFDLSAIPPGSIITAASLSMTLTMSNPSAGTRPVALHSALAPWGEGSTAPPAPGGFGGDPTTDSATWQHHFWPAQAWATPGGEFTPLPSASLPVSGPGVYKWITEDLMVDVMTWANDPASNHGWIVLGDESTPGGAKRFASREAADPRNRPRLIVVFIPPAGMGACCLAGGLCRVLSGVDCAAQGGIYQGDAAACSDNPCSLPTGACCLTDGACTATSAAACASSGGVYQGDGVACTTSVCATLEGACCFANATCAALGSGACASQGGTFEGVGTSCVSTKCPWVLAPFVDALPIPGIAQPDTGQVGGAATYTMTLTEQSQHFHRDLPATRVWGLNGGYPGPTIVASQGQPVEVTWVNDLRDEQGALRQHHPLAVDTCIHGADEFGDQPRTVMHLHGGHVPMDSDGFPLATILPGQRSAPFHYPNAQPAATVWYHDHAMGITRLNTYMGIAGFYLIRDANELSLGLPTGEFEVGLAIQDRSFKPDGSLDYPDMWMDHFFGDFIVVNGKVWPFLEVKRGKYRFRMINGSTSRAYTLALSTQAPMQQIGSDLGLLASPVSMPRITILPGERADVVIDFAPYAPGTEIILTNSAPAPYPGPAGQGVVANVMKFIVGSQSGHTAPIPPELATIPRWGESSASRAREFTLQKTPGVCTDTRWTINGMMWDEITEIPRLGTAEVWSFINRSGVSHPMHLHLVRFQILDRQPFQVIDGVVTPTGEPTPPPPNEAGWKDTVRCDPQQITRIIARFEDFLGDYSYHCHILEHEENEMMRQFRTTCYANCDGSAQPPVLNVADFSCFLQQYAAGNPYANCDASTQPPLLNILDFSCFLQRYAAGCR